MIDNTPRTSALVCINSVEIVPIVIREQRVLTLAQIDKVHGRPEGTARKRFNDNKVRLIEGQEYFVVSPSEIRTHSPDAVPLARKSDMTVVTESGYLLLVKSFTDDLAWQVQRELVNAYFRTERVNVLGERYDTLLPSEAQTLHEIIDRKAAATGDQKRKAYGEIYNRLQNTFRVNPYTLLPRTQLADAIVYVTGMELHCAPSTPVADPNDYERISSKQRDEIAQEVHYCLSGWVFGDNDTVQVYNTLHVAFHIRNITDLPVEEFDHCLILIAAIKETYMLPFLILVNEAKRSLFEDHLRAGVPWTPHITRQWKAKTKAALPARPDWIAMQRQLKDTQSLNRLD